ncbi:response regulator transcription factor [Rhodovulum sp. DZ06]|uniref:helix-turn-helix transcriptional regulator n=1 Tax=Rhodovulum sp. DZ06 TaxID=3425126 RepID=UPI003D350B6C
MTDEEFERHVALYLQRLEAMIAPDRVWEASLEAFSMFGTGWLSFGLTDMEATSLYAFRTAIPGPVIADYVARGLRKHDHIPRACREGRTTMTYLPDLPGARAAGDASRVLLDTFLAEKGVRRILGHPFYEGGRSACLFFLILDGPEPYAQEEERFRVLTTLFRAHYDADGDPRGALEPALAREYGLMSAREREVLWRLANGLGPAQAAEKMHISTAAARKALVSAQEKLGARTRDEAIAIAHRLGMMQPVESEEE